MMIEQNTNYAYKLKYMDNPTFDKVRDLAVKFYCDLPQELRDELYEALNRGIDILDSEPQMTAYMFSFGKMHQAKLEYAFGKLPEEFLGQPEINIIDYGCGQALGTMCYADFLRKKSCSQKVKTITLIEPSEICLKRAALHASAFFPDASIKTVNKSFDDLVSNNIVCKKTIPTLHILSNVLDLAGFSLKQFAELVNSCLLGDNQFVCVGPYFKDKSKDDRMVSFSKLVNGKDIYQKNLDCYQLDSEKAWTCSVCLFRVKKNEKEDSVSLNNTSEKLHSNTWSDVNRYGIIPSIGGMEEREELRRMIESVKSATPKTTPKPPINNDGNKKKMDDSERKRKKKAWITAFIVWVVLGIVFGSLIAIFDSPHNIIGGVLWAGFIAMFVGLFNWV